MSCVVDRRIGTPYAYNYLYENKTAPVGHGAPARVPSLGRRRVSKMVAREVI